MVMGRGSALALLCITTMVVALCSSTAEGAVYTVGGPAGWTFDMVSWTAGKRFRAGDVLVFRYNSIFHNVVAVNAAGYRSCTTPPGSKVWRSGNDRITLRRGTTYFICNLPGHCAGNMKIAVTAL